MKKSGILLAIFVILNFCVIGANGDYQAFYCLEQVLIPFIDGKINILYLILNYIVVLIFVLEIVKNLNNLFELYPYILARNSKKNISKIYIKRNIKIIFQVIIIKGISDILMGQLVGLNRFDIFIKLYISMFLTFIVWSLFILIQYLFLQNQKKVLFLSLVTLFLCQYLAITYQPFLIFAIAGQGIYNSYYVIIIFKVLVLMMLIYITFYLFKKIEVLGGEKND